MATKPLQQIPGVDTLLNEPAIAALVPVYGRAALVDACRAVLQQIRAQPVGGAPVPARAEIAHLIRARLAEEALPSLRPVINATGVIIHTNLGRAPLSAA